MKHDLEGNKQNAIAFYRTAYLGAPAKAVELYVGAEYIQHNPLVGDGKQAFIDYFSHFVGLSCLSVRCHPVRSIVCEVAL